MFLKWNCVFIFYFLTRHCLAQCTFGFAHPSYNLVMETGSIPFSIHSALAGGFTVVQSCLSFHLRVVAHHRSTVWPLVTFKLCLSLKHASKEEEKKRKKNSTAPKDSLTHKHPGSSQHTASKQQQHPNFTLRVTILRGHWFFFFISIFLFYVAVCLWNLLMLHKSLVWTHSTMM